MAELVGVFAASHTPVMLNFPDAITAADLALVRQGFQDLGRRIAALEPQAIVLVSDDHMHNFFLNNLPPFCVGIAESYATPIEDWLKAERRVLPGHAAMGAHLLGEAYEQGFDPAYSMQLTLDHGFLTPLELAGIARRVPLLPITVNCVQPPLPTLRRCIGLGRFIGKAIRSYAGLERVVLLATGGLSHDVGTPRMGLVNEAFDREFLRLLAAGDEQQLLAYTSANVNSAGNGAEEVRTWLVAHGAAAGMRPETLCYKALPDWYCGIGIAQWPVGH
jgi:aromatic ring-opening dioxygenase catalytic subunit (LigB family)